MCVSVSVCAGVSVSVCVVPPCLVDDVGAKTSRDHPRGVVGLENVSDFAPPSDVSPCHPLDVDGVQRVHSRQLYDEHSPDREAEKDTTR